jgi:N-acetylmuramoyl-L-alanine amidase
MAKIVLSNAHCQKAQGATFCGKTEWLYSQRVNAIIRDVLEGLGHEVTVIEEGGTANEDLNKTIREINKLNADCAVENHLNGNADPKASYGSEVICYPGSKDGRGLAAAIADRFAYLPINQHGVDERKDLGFLRSTNCPAVITEPLFITHELENKFLDFDRGIEVIGILIAEGILTWLERQGG